MTHSENLKERNDEVFSKIVKAGKRTYFFDVKSTRGNDLYLTMTESKKTFENGVESFQKHKIFLYKEDFQKFKDCFDEVLMKIESIKSNESSNENENDFTSISFENL